MPFHGALGASGVQSFLSLYSMINLAQSARMLHPLRPTPVTGLSARRRRRKCPGLPSARKIATWRLRAVTKVTVGNMSNCRFGRDNTLY